jgi:hypothetical protein
MLRQLTQFWRFAILFAATLSCPGAAQAGVCGVSSYACCPVPACATASCYTACRVTTQTCMQTVCETVWEPEEYQTKRTVYENVWDEVQTTCYRQVTETAYRDEQYTVKSSGPFSVPWLSVSIATVCGPFSDRSGRIASDKPATRCSNPSRKRASRSVARRS